MKSQLCIRVKTLDFVIYLKLAWYQFKNRMINIIV